jgi:Ca2+-binding EF-hand superfamily protein
MLTSFQRRKLTRYFNVLDRDGNGYFELEDLELIARRLAKSHNIPLGSEEHRGLLESMGLIWDHGRQYGISKDPNRISLADWLAHEDYVLSTKEWREKYMEKITLDVFDLVDTNSNGLINVDDFSRIMRSFGVEEGIPEWSFAKMDVDNNGTISRQEFLSLVEAFHLSNDRSHPGNFLFGPY